MNPFKIKYHAHPFEVGDKVLLVTTGPKDPRDFSEKLVPNRPYVIRETSHCDVDDSALVRLVGVFGRESWDGTEFWLRASHFISLTELRANIAERLAARRGLKLDFMPDVEPKKQNVGKTRGKRKAAA